MQLTRHLFFHALSVCTSVRVYCYKGGYLSLIPVHQIRWQLSVRLFSTTYYTYPEAGILAKENRLVMKWYRFLDHKYSVFNSIISRLIALKILKSHKLFGAHKKPTRALPQTPNYNYDCFAITLSLRKLNLVEKNDTS